jgi:arsenate reductase-like glutaredoxin family protein
MADLLLKFDSIYLNYFGTWFAFVLVLTGWSAYKGEIEKRYFYLLIFVALVFETIMLGYQYFASPEMCMFCMGVYAFLLVMMLLASPRHFVMVLPIIGAVLLALSFLAIPKQKPFVIKNGTYLIHSESCSHCKRVKKYFKEHDISYEKIDIANVEAKNFSTFLNLPSIPTMIIKDGKSMKVISGDSFIIDYFDIQNKPSVKSIKKESSEPINVDALYQNSSDEEGCGIAALVKKKEGCKSSR